MMTGRYPHRVNVINSHTPLNTEYKTIAEVVKSKGYRTIMRMGNPFFPQETNADQGFDSYESIGSVPSGEGPSEFQKNLDGEKLYYRLHVLGSHDPFNPSPRYYNYSDYQYIKEINTSLSTKVHKHRARYRETLNTSIFENISAEERRKIIDHYDENIRALDQYIGYYIDKLKEEDEYRDSMIIITSDYGMSLNTNPSTSRVPLVVKYPEADRSSRSEKLVSIMDPFKIILNEVDGSLDYELDAIDPRKQSRDLHYTYTKRGSSITNSTHFAFNNLLRRTWSYYKIHNNKFRSVEKAFPDLKGSLSSFTWSFQNTEYNTTDFGYEDIRG
jgi:arylsulfatase A-like enzyme